MDGNQYEALKIENQLCFPMYACSREIIKLYKPWLDKMDLTYTQYITMLVLWEDHTLTVKSLGEKLYLDSGTLTPLLKKLEQKGLVSRKRSVEDERNLLVSLTKEGEALRETALSMSGEMQSCAGITDEEQKVLSGMLMKLLRRTEEKG
ncbi:MAG: MarR family transcriptional regulator [Oscillospiraceae bacterium]|nr:MarR family transcriptional regulator [Oscillospiraceae bacterium]